MAVTTESPLQVKENLFFRSVNRVFNLFFFTCNFNKNGLYLTKESKDHKYVEQHS